MSKASDALKQARKRIAKALADGATKLDLHIANLAEIPAEITTLTALQTLTLSNTPVADLSPLTALTALQTLWLDNTQVADLTPLTALTALRRLWVSDTKVVDLRPIRAMNTVPNRDPHPLNLVFTNTPATLIDPTLRDLSQIEDNADRTTRTLEYLNSGDYDPDRLANQQIEAALAGPVLSDAIADIEHRLDQFVAVPVVRETARPRDQTFAQLVEVLAFTANHLATSNLQNRVGQAVIRNLQDYGPQVQRPDPNPRILNMLADGLTAAMADDDGALDGMDRAGFAALLKDHQDLIRAYYPESLRPLSFTSQADPQVLAQDFRAAMVGATAVLAAATTDGLLHPSVSDAQEILLRMEEGARRGYVTALPADKAIATARLREVAVREAGFIGRIFKRLQQHLVMQKTFIAENPATAARNLAGIIYLVKELAPWVKILWDIVAPFLGFGP